MTADRALEMMKGLSATDMGKMDGDVIRRMMSGDATEDDIKDVMVVYQDAMGKGSEDSDQGKTGRQLDEFPDEEKLSADLVLRMIQGLQRKSVSELDGDLVRKLMSGNATADEIKTAFEKVKKLLGKQGSTTTTTSNPV